MRNLIRKAAILAGAATGKWTFTGPDCVLISINGFCNFSCLNCRFHSSHTQQDTAYRPKEKRIPLELVRKLAPELRAARVGVIVVSAAGEPLLNPELPEIIRLLKTSSASIKLLTNGSLLKESLARLLIDQAVDDLRVSMWAKDEEEFASNYPGTDVKFFGRVKENLKRLTRLKKARGKTAPRLSIHHPINRNNFRNLHLLLPLAEELGVNEISFSALIPYPEVDQKSLLTEEDLPRLKEELFKLRGPLKERNISHNIEQTIFQQKAGADMIHRIGCYNGWFQLRIQEDGDASPCNTCNIFVGNAHESTVMELWKGKAMQNFRERACTFRGLGEISRDGFCDYCSSYHINRKIHRIVSRLPFTRAGR